MALEIRNRLQRSFGQPLRSTLAFDYPTIDAVARHLVFGPQRHQQGRGRFVRLRADQAQDPAGVSAGNHVVQYP